MGSSTPIRRNSQLDCSWLSRVDLKQVVDTVGTPTFVYSEEQLRKNVRRINDAAAAVGLGDRVELYIPFFPNSNPHILAPLRDMGAGLLLQLPGEYAILQQHGFDKFIVSPGHVSNEEIGFWATTGYPTFLASLDEIAYALEAKAPSISARIDSLDSGKPGIKLAQLDKLISLLAKYGRSLECFEVYHGSGNSLGEMIDVIELLFKIFQENFPSARSINFAGGMGFVYEEWDEAAKHFDWPTYFRALRATADRMGVPDHIKFLFEPARDVLADTGALLLGVKRDVITSPVSNIVVTDGSRMLMPSAQLRDRSHNVAFLDASMREIHCDQGVPAAVRGCTILRHDYILPGDYWVPRDVDRHSHLLILDAGVYCATQHMEFLNVPPTAEVLIDLEGAPHLVSVRGEVLDKWRNLLPAKKPLSAIADPAQQAIGSPR